MENSRFEKLIDALESFYVFDELEKYKDDPMYNYFTDMISKLYYEIIALDTIDKVDGDV